MAPGFFDGEITEQDERKILEWMRTYKQNWTDRDWTQREVLRGIDLEMQLLAIKSLLSRNQQAEDDLKREIDDLHKQFQQEVQAVRAGQEAQDSGDYRWQDRLYEAFFEDTANGMAAVGMLAPFVEALFVAVFQRFKEEGTTEPSPEDPRRQATERYFWDPHWVVHKQGKPEKDLVKGISQLAGSIGLERFLPEDYGKTLQALFLYRNKMFHCGLEWPEKERINFRSQKNNWPAEWFQETTKNTKNNEAPWLFSMSPEFIQHCLQTIDGILDGVGAYARDRASEKNSVSPA